jgi:hypothetical protein
MSIETKVKTALGEARLLVLGTQIFVGFQFNLVFQDAFRVLPAISHALAGVALMLMVGGVGLLVLLPMQHRLVKQGRSSKRILRLSTGVSAAALVPFALSLGIDFFIVGEHVFSLTIGLVAAAAALGSAVALWYALGWSFRRDMGHDITMQASGGGGVPLEMRIEQLLTEARVVLPGAQAVLGFQLIAIFTQSFEALPFELKIAHAFALSAVTLAVILLMAPAAFHRIAFGGEDSETFLTIGSVLVTTSSFPLACGLSANVFVAMAIITGADRYATAAAAVIFLIVCLLWYVHPIVLRARRKL